MKAKPALLIAALAGTLHAAASLYWGFGGTLLRDTLGQTIVSQWSTLSWVLLPVGIVKLVAALAPVILHRLHWPRPWRAVSWAGAVVLLAWGGSSMVTAWLVLAGVVGDGAYDAGGIIGRAFLWDPLFALWGGFLAWGLWRSRGSTPRTLA